MTDAVLSEDEEVGSGHFLKSREPGRDSWMSVSRVVWLAQ